jgi:hypothetical protein
MDNSKVKYPISATRENSLLSCFFPESPAHLPSHASVEGTQSDARRKRNEHADRGHEAIKAGAFTFELRLTQI